AICGMKIPRFTSSKPSKFSFASDEKSIRRPTTSFVRRCLKCEKFPAEGLTFGAIRAILALVDLTLCRYGGNGS
ncbi:MAG: hypothetical protein Q4B19_05160, partial [Clostridia bacterium]|nr:hypothetical protein [Clostridia bacterium]